jgi:hypothetical protein
MGLPARWTDAEHGLCLSLWAALMYLQERGVSAVVDKNLLYYTDAAQDNVRIIVEPVQIAAVGVMYPVRVLDTLCETP